MKKIRLVGKKVLAHLERNKSFYTGVCFSLGYALVASILLDPSVAFADIDSGGARIHKKVVGIGKWVIVIKGTIETIKSVLDGDYLTAKTQFFQYLFCFAIMLALPWCLTEIEGVF